MTQIGSKPGNVLSGTIRVPGDKSISHRALMIGAAAVGQTRISGLLEADDVLRTAEAVRALGARIQQQNGNWLIEGVGPGGFVPPDGEIDLGNSGTAARLLLGLLATQEISVSITGDESLRSRPMGRVIDPLSLMGANFEAEEDDRMPLRLRGTGEPIPVEYLVPVPSAQVKSAVLLAALNTPGRTTVREREATRDHTENMLKSFGAAISVEDSGAGGRKISVDGFAELTAVNVDVPGDPSSAAFPGVAALLIPGSEITVENVGLNPLRAGLFDTLIDMGANIEIMNRRDSAGEAVGDIVFRFGALQGADIPANRAPSMIDEYPIAAIAAAFADGETRFRGLAELRVKESDRFAAIIDGLAACGVDVRADGDDIVICGDGTPPPGGAKIVVNLDHRIAMAFLVMGLAAEAPVTIDDAAAIETSFPCFIELMIGLGGKIV